MRFDKATTMLARIARREITSSRQAADLMDMNPSTVWRWVAQLRELGVVINTTNSPWRIISYGPFQKPRGRK